MPQWSRNCEPPDPLSTNIFLSTMRSFHKLCFCSGAALLIFKRGGGVRDIAEPGSLIPSSSLSLRGFDAERGRNFSAELRQLLAEATSSLSARAAESLQVAIKAVDEVGIDLEYAIRAWCVLERCYIPETQHTDVRILQLLPALSTLRGECLMIMAKKDIKAVGSMVSVIDEIESILDIAECSRPAQRLYQNAWAYHYLKKKVLTITNPDDYKYLDPLIVNKSVILEGLGGLYLQSIAGVKGIREWRDPDMHFPQNREARRLLKRGVGLFDLLGKECWEVGLPVSMMGGASIA